MRGYPERMRKFGLLALAVAALGACATGAASTAPTALTVTYWEDGSQPGERITWTLRCNPARGTLRRPAVACRRLRAGGAKLFAPVPKNAICTQIYGGPQVARVVGIVSGKRVSARLSRVNGCQIARWNQLSPWLLPRGGVT